MLTAKHFQHFKNFRKFKKKIKNKFKNLIFFKKNIKNCSHQKRLEIEQKRLKYGTYLNILNISNFLKNLKNP